MPGLLIIAHAPLASSLKAVAEHAFPDCAGQLAALDVLPNVPVEEVEAQAAPVLERLAAPERADLHRRLRRHAMQHRPAARRRRPRQGRHRRQRADALAHACATPTSRSTRVVARAIAGATQGVMQVATARPQNQTLKRAAMIKATARISNKLGLHARASAKLSKLAGSFRTRRLR